MKENIVVYAIIALWNGDAYCTDYKVYSPSEVIVDVYETKEDADEALSVLNKYKDDNISMFVIPSKLK